MKKYIIGLIVIAILVISGGVAHAQTVASNNVMTMPSGPTCYDLPNNLGQSIKAFHDDVVVLQGFLYAGNYLKIKPTGFFGSLTTQAVIKFQKEHGLPATGYVGALTRAALKKLTCNNPIATSSVTVIAPKGGETWQRGTSQNIIWNYKSEVKNSFDVYIATSINITLTPYPNACTGKTVCPFMMIAPYIVARNVANNGSYNWTVGTLQDAQGRTLPDGTYIVTVCTFDNSACGQSASSITISSNGVPAPTPTPVSQTPVITSLSTMSGPVGTTVTLTGTGFTTLNNTIHFSIGGTLGVLSNNGTILTYKIPSGVSACDLIQTFAACGSPEMPIQPNTYNMYVTNQNGTSNTVTFTVTQY